MLSRLTAFPYYGGKSIHLNWLLPRLPMTQIYIEPFGGSAAVLLNRDKSVTEIYNDLSGTVVNFFRVLRDQRDELIEKMSLTLYSREELETAARFIRRGREYLERWPVEWARCFFVTARQSFMANRKDWVTADVTSGKLHAWWSGIAGLDRVYERFKGVQIDCFDALSLIKKFDKPEVLMYQDPPYLHSTRVLKEQYDFEMTEEQHAELAEFNLQSKAKIAISGYKSVLYTELYDDNGWHRTDWETSTGSRTASRRTESLWTNYNPDEVRHVDQTGLDEYFKLWRNNNRINGGKNNAE